MPDRGRHLARIMPATALDALWVHQLAPKLFVTLRAEDLTDGNKIVGITRTDTVFRTQETFIRGRVVFLGLRCTF